MSDTLQRFLFENAGVRGALVHLDASWRAVLERHTYPEPVRDVLGEAMAACVLLSATLKIRGSIIMQVQGNGPISLMVVESTSQRSLRGLAHWKGEVPNTDLHAKFGDGRLVITIDPGEGFERYQGIVPLEGNTLAEALDSYLERSEQLATRLWLSADGQQAAGLLLQKLPSPSEDADAWNRVTTLGSTVTPAELLALEPRPLMRRLFHEEDVRVFDDEAVFFRCSCTRERVANMLRNLGPAEVESIVAEQGSVAVNCDFCNQHYVFDAVDAAQLFAPKPSTTSVAPTRH
jgi:molecular chaperone Hsp33